MPRIIRSLRRHTMLLCAALLFIAARTFMAQTPSEPIPLWPANAAEVQGVAPADVPEIIVFMPARVRTSTGILVIPGGGYSHLSLPTEGVEIAQFLNAAGIPAFVLKYRLSPAYRYPVQLHDGLRAIRYLRANAARFKLERVGVIGFSAGGHLASQLGTSFDTDNPSAADPVDRLSSRPDFMVLGYPVISDPGFAAEGSLRNIDPDTSHSIAKTKPGVVTQPAIDPRLVELLSTDLHVTTATPPTFLVCADDDHSVLSENSIRFYRALNRAGVPAELHIYQHGRHGFGLAAWDPIDSTWTALMLDWLRANNFLPPIAETAKP